jgi:hypothetical protein
MGAPQQFAAAPVWRAIAVSRARPVGMTRRSLLSASAAALGLVGASGCKRASPASCTDVSSLTPEERNVRTSLGYADRTPVPGKPCIKCVQYVAPPSSDQCGACKVMKGPVHPAGYCRVFAPRV